MADTIVSGLARARKSRGPGRGFPIYGFLVADFRPLLHFHEPVEHRSDRPAEQVAADHESEDHPAFLALRERSAFRCCGQQSHQAYEKPGVPGPRPQLVTQLHSSFRLVTDESHIDTPSTCDTNEGAHRVPCSPLI